MDFFEKSSDDRAADRTLCHTDHLLSGRPGYDGRSMRIRGPAPVQHGLRFPAAAAGLQWKADPVLEPAAEAMEYSIGADDPVGHLDNITGYQT